MEAAKVYQLFREPFETEHLKPIMRKNRETGEYFKLRDVKYITVRQVMDRLDEVVGNTNWWAEYTVINENTVRCRLHVRIDGEVCWKEDFGYNDSQSNLDSGLKGAASDALKRAAVQFGIGRYLYEDIDSGNGGSRQQQAGGSGNRYQRRDDAGSNTEPRREYRRPRQQEQQESDIMLEFGNVMGKFGVTTDDFRETFGVELSEPVLRDMLNDGWSYAEIATEMSMHKP